MEILEFTWICISDAILLHMLWVDDFVMAPCTSKHAQRQLDGLSNFAHPTKMVANELKTKYMFFDKLNDYSLQLNGKHHENVSSHRYVGNMISCNRLLSGDILKENSDFLCNKTRQSVFGMIGKLTKLDEPTRTILFFISDVSATGFNLRQWCLGSKHRGLVRRRQRFFISSRD